MAQLLSRLKLIEQRIVDLYHKFRKSEQDITDIYDSIDSLNNIVNPLASFITYKFKVATRTIDWPGMGYIYNWFAASDIRNIANTSVDNWRVPSSTDFNTLRTYLGGAPGGNSPLVSIKLKSTIEQTITNFTQDRNGWPTGLTGTDDFNFNMIPSTNISFGNFQPNLYAYFWTSTNSTSTLSVAYFSNIFEDIFTDTLIPFPWGCSIRLVRDASVSELLLADGTYTTPYIGNNSIEYSTVKIGTQIWICSNLKETMYDNGDSILDCSGTNQSSILVNWNNATNSGIGAWTSSVVYQNLIDPKELYYFYNEQVENYAPENFIWEINQDLPSLYYTLSKESENLWNKTFIRVTPMFDTTDVLNITEKTLDVEQAQEGELNLVFYPIKKTASAYTIENLNNYNLQDPINTSYIYVEISERQY